MTRVSVSVARQSVPLGKPSGSPPPKPISEQAHAAAPRQDAPKDQRAIQGAPLGKAKAAVPLFSDTSKQIIGAEVKKTIVQDGGKAVATQGVKVANKVILKSSVTLGELAARRATRAMTASVPLLGAGISAVDAHGDLKRAQEEAKAGNQWASRAFRASGSLNAIDASLGVAATGAAATGVGLGAAAALEVLGWASTGAGFVLGVGGEYLSQQKR
jgi:hypothetical protein